MELGTAVDGTAWRLAVAIGIGLLLGLERERRKGSGPSRGFAGIRTFSLVSLLGGTAMALGGVPVVAVGLGFVGAVAIAGYVLSDRSDPGVTTEVALPVTFLLGALAQEAPQLAAGVGVSVAVLLAAREFLQRVVAQALSEQELHDGLLLGAAALVILPMLPNEAIGPYDAFNPFTIWRLVVLVMLVSAAGYVATRLLGTRLGLPIAGFASGFVSSAATIAAMGTRARKQPAVLGPAIAAAVLSTLSTVIQMVMVVGATDSSAMRAIWPSMAAAGVAATTYGVVAGLRAWRNDGELLTAGGRAFEPRAAIVFAATVSLIIFASALLNDLLGDFGVTLSAAVAGFADTHAAAISVASLVASGRLDPDAATVSILAAFTTNSVTKAVLGWTSGGRSFALAIWPGLVLVLLAAWAGRALESGGFWS